MIKLLTAYKMTARRRHF